MGMLPFQTSRGAVRGCSCCIAHQILQELTRRGSDTLPSSTSKEYKCWYVSLRLALLQDFSPIVTIMLGSDKQFSYSLCTENSGYIPLLCGACAHVAVHWLVWMPAHNLFVIVRRGCLNNSFHMTISILPHFLGGSLMSRIRFAAAFRVCSRGTRAKFCNNILISSHS